jgi:hypothetical protein
MNFRPALLLGGAVLIAVAPAWADGIAYHGSAKEPGKFEIGVKDTDKSSLRMNELVNAEFRTGPAKAGGLADFAPSADLDIHHADLSDFDSHERGSFFWRYEKDAHRERGEHEWHDPDGNIDKKNLAAVSMPEPGSLSLLLTGLAALGFLARRRGELPIAT